MIFLLKKKHPKTALKTAILEVRTGAVPSREKWPFWAKNNSLISFNSKVAKTVTPPCAARSNWNFWKWGPKTRFLRQKWRFSSFYIFNKIQFFIKFIKKNINFFFYNFINFIKHRFIKSNACTGVKKLKSFL